MSVEYINRISYKKDGVYISTKSCNDDMPYHVVKLDRLSEIYLKEGKQKADLEFAQMFMDYCEPRGSHKSVLKFKALFADTKMTEKSMDFYDKRSEIYEDFKKNNKGYDMRKGLFGKWKEELDQLKEQRNAEITEFFDKYEKNRQVER